MLIEKKIVYAEVLFLSVQEVVSYYIKWVTTSWAYSIQRKSKVYNYKWLKETNLHEFFYQNVMKTV